MMWSHLPDPVLVHVEKRSLGHRDTQLIPGRGHQEALLNVEEDLTHHLTFQARYTHIYSHTHTHILTHTHIYTHTHTHIHTHIYSHTHINTHTHII